jgi:hypothetical protein
MAGLLYSLKVSAKNSTTDVKLFIDKDTDGMVLLTLCGNHCGTELQIDFDSLTVSEAAELANFLTMRANGNPTV